jgi:hypothetical protein
MSVCCECCVLLGRGLRRADHSSRGVLPSVVCLSMIVKPRKMRRPRPPKGLSSHWKKITKASSDNGWLHQLIHNNYICVTVRYTTAAVDTASRTNRDRHAEDPTQ